MEVSSLIEIIQCVSESNLTGFQYEENGVRIKCSKKENYVQASGIACAPAAPAVTAAAAPETVLGAAPVSDALPEGKVVKSPLVGIFYTAPAQDAESFVKVGDVVKKGQTLAIVEAMKLMNEIEAEFDGTVAEVLVKDGEPVEYGQPLFRFV